MICKVLFHLEIRLNRQIVDSLMHEDAYVLLRLKVAVDLIRLKEGGLLCNLAFAFKLKLIATLIGRVWKRICCICLSNVI